LINKNAVFVLLASLIITSLFGCGGGGGSASSNGTQTVLTLAWDAPTTKTDGSNLNPATDLSLYKIYYGTASLTYTQVVNVTNPGTTTISETLNLSPGTYYFAVTTVDASGLESDFSNEVMKTI
jgi:fibronectin type 3 domain-containing protein